MTMPDRITLTPARQAAYHLGCAVRNQWRSVVHVWRAVVAFAPVAILMGLLLILALFVFSLAGCASAPGKTWWNPTTWTSGKEGAELADTKREAAARRDAVLKEAQKATHETGQALASAPASRPVSVASESNATASALLDQALGGLRLEDQTKLRERVAALLSENEAIRSAAEHERTAARASASELSRLYEAARAAEIKASSDLAAAFDRENALANKHRNAELQKWAGFAFSGLMTALALYLKFNPASVPAAAIGKALAFADRDAPHKATAVRDLLDDFLNRGEQAQILSHVVKHSAKLR